MHNHIAINSINLETRK
ncbi:hypothetical protein GHK79_12885 [Enterococcus faecium]|nr:hypothetical protein [Enterococcus faecium]